MPRQHLANNAFSTLSVAVTTSGQATLTLQTGHGARFPSPQNPDYFMVTLDDGTNVEVCTCIARSGDALTVLRGQEGTTAQSSFATGTRVALRITAETARMLEHRFARDTLMLKAGLNVASWSWLGLRLPTQVGSVRASALTNSTWRTTQPRIRIGTANSVQVALKWYVPDAVVNVGQGFRATYRFGMLNTPNSSHFFIGLVNTTGAVASVHPPSSLTQAVVVGWTGSAGNATPPELSLWYNDNSGNAVQRALGSYFTCSSDAWYEVELWCAGNTVALEYAVKRLDISSIADARSYLLADIPTNSAWLSPYMSGSPMVTSAMDVELGFFQINN